METIYKIVEKEIIFNNFDDYFNIWFWGDVHRDASGCDVDRWQEFLKTAAKDDPEKTYYMGLGDYHDLASAREQKHLSKDSLHETTMETLDEKVEQNNRVFAKEISQMRNRLLGLIDGNHNWRFPNSVTASEDLANRMGCEHLGWLCHYTLKIRVGGKSHNLYIVACHGRAGGKRAGASINQVEDIKTIFPIADVYVMGHDHNRGAWPVDVLYPLPTRNGVVIKQKRQFLCRSGSFLKGYEKNKSTYVTGRLLRPSDLGALKLIISLKRVLKKGKDYIVPDIKAVI